MQLVTYAARPVLAWAAVKGPVVVWAVTPAPQKPVAPTTAKSASADTVLFPDIVMFFDPQRCFPPSCLVPVKIAAFRKELSDRRPAAETSDPSGAHPAPLLDVPAEASPTSFRPAPALSGCSPVCKSCRFAGPQAARD